MDYVKFFKLVSVFKNYVFVARGKILNYFSIVKMKLYFIKNRKNSVNRYIFTIRKGIKILCYQEHILSVYICKDIYINETMNIQNINFIDQDSWIKEPAGSALYACQNQTFMFVRQRGGQERKGGGGGRGLKASWF